MTNQDALARLLGEFPDVVVVLSAEGFILWANERAEDLFGQTLQETMGQSGLDFVHPDDLELVLRSLVSVQSKEVGTFLEVRVKAGPGWRLVELIGVAVSWFEEGAILFSLRDLTERRRFEVARGDDARLRSLVQNAATITMLVNPDGRIDSVSGALTRVLGHDPELIEQKPLADLVAPDDRPMFRSALDAALWRATAAHPVVVEVRLRRFDSPETIPFELTIVNLVDDLTVEGLVITAHDVSARTAAEADLRNTLSLLRATLDSTADGILVVADGKITSINARFAQMWHLPEEVLTGGEDATVLEFVTDQLVDPHGFLAKIAELYAQPESESNDIIAFKDGRVFERYSRPQTLEGEIIGRVWSFRDITDRTKLENDLSYQSFHDGLTGLANQALFRDRLSQAVARTERTHKHIAVLFLDLDDFKMINDSLGHSFGDEVLCTVAEVLHHCLRPSDTVARMGGDEFAVLIEDVEHREEVIRLAERILTATRRPVTIGERELSTTFSMGIAFGVPGSTSELLLRNADLAMYMAKGQGKNCYDEFQAQMHTTVMDRLELEGDLRRALVGEEFVVFYQPIVELAAGAIVGFEALVRWRHPTKGLLAPDAFIPFAEEVGLIDVIDQFVLARACAQARRWQDEGLAAEDLLISVNLSARELVDTGIEASVAESIVASGFTPSNLILEITESAMMKDTESAVRNLHALKGLGVRIALDDFGTGYSSLAHLERLPIDILKIDRSFVATIALSKKPVDLANAIVQLGQSLGHVTIAEGVENEAQADALRVMGCLFAQGYHLGRPLNSDATEELLRSRLTLSTS
jgi:diguanylate cyclase (GGDEF)-like protein/PAS domain S-box-containing protein